MFSLSQCIYHILFIISSPTLSALLLVLSPIELPYHGIVLGGPSRRLVKFSPPYSQELKGPGKGEVMKWDFFSPFFEEYGLPPLKSPLCTSPLVFTPFSSPLGFPIGSFCHF